MLTTASQLSARSRHVRAAASLAPSATLLARSQQQPQVRCFRFGRAWSVYSDQEQPPRDSCRRGRKMRYKSEDRRPTWENLTPPNPSGTRPGRNIEDVERSPVDHLVSGDRSSSATFWGWTLRSVGDSDYASMPHVADDFSSSSPSSKHEYVIDPITNRKIPQHDVEAEAAANSSAPSAESPTPFNASRIDGAQNPVFYDGAPTEQELKEYDQVPIDPTPWEPLPPQTANSFSDDALSQQRQPILESQEYVANHTSDQPSSSAASRPKVYDEFAPLGADPSGISWFKSAGLAPSQPQRSDVVAAPAPEFFGSKVDGAFRAGTHDEPATTAIDPRAPQYDDLTLYGSVKAGEPLLSAKAAETAPQRSEPFIDEPAPGRDLEGYTPFAYNEPDGKPSSEDLNKNYGLDEPHEFDPAELKKYEAFRYNEPDGLPPHHVQPEAEYDPRELLTYGPFRHNEPDGIASSSKFSEDEWATAPPLGRLPPLGNIFDGRGLATGLNDGSNRQKVLESLMARHAARSDAADAEAVSAVRHSRARDAAPARLQSALDRTRPRKKPFAAVDPYSRAPQGLETSYAEERAGQSTWPTFVQHYTKSMNTNESAGGEPYAKFSSSSGSSGREGASSATEPTLYRILAYDPTMQSVTTAETTFVVSSDESHPPLSPDEVLPRLSHPSKFLPYFAPLRAQGFEIASGSGDVLVFRRVRDDTPTPDKSDSPVNPIDMTGGPANTAASRFASPTGFVNYELPPSEPQSSPPGPQSSSSSDSTKKPRREEPVFSGRPKTEPRERPARRSLPKRVFVGAAWLAGISYALGVVGEYFKTGGADGRGPRGL